MNIGTLKSLRSLRSQRSSQDVRGSGGLDLEKYTREASRGRSSGAGGRGYGGEKLEKYTEFLDQIKQNHKSPSHKTKIKFKSPRRKSVRSLSKKKTKSRRASINKILGMKSASKTPYGSLSNMSKFLASPKNSMMNVGRKSRKQSLGFFRASNSKRIR